jgi:S-layer protein
MAIPAWFDEYAYLNSKLNQITSSGDTGYTTINQVKTAILNAGFTSTYEHFAAYSLAERTSPNDYFNTNEYLAAKAAQMGGTWTADKVALAFQNAGYTNAYDHFVAWGWQEGVNPSNAFDISLYLESKAAESGMTVDEVTEAFAAAGLDPISHYVLYGQDEAGVTVSEVPASEQVDPDTTSGSAGQTFTLTTGLDVVTGTNGDDTIIGDFTATASLNAGDQINGGSGTDTIKMYGTFASGNVPVAISNVEVMDIANTAAGNIDLSSWTKAATGITSVVFDNASALTGNSITTTAGQSLSLSTGNSNLGTAGAVTWIASATDTSANLTLNGYQGASTAVAQALTITAPLAVTQNIASTGAANKVTTLTLGATTNKVVVTGDQALSVTTDLVSSGGATVLKTVDASAATGGVAITVAALTNAAFAFTGGTGNDSIKFADNGLASLTAGSQLDGGAGTADKIGLLDTAISTTEYTAINAAKNFEVLGLNAAVTVDASQLTSIKSFSIDANAAQSVTNMGTGSSLVVTAAHAAALSTTTAVTVHDLAFTIGKSTTAGLALGAVTIGQDTVALSSLGTTTGVNSITALTAKDNSVYTITGSNDLTITAITAATASGSKYDASALTGKLSITANAAAFTAGSALGDTFIGGTAADTLVAGLNSSTLTGNGGADTFNVAAAVAAAAPGAGLATGSTIDLTTITDFAKGDKLVFGATAGAFTAAKVDLSSAASLGAALDLLVAGANTDIKWGTYNGNTYIVDDVAAGATVAATDTVVKLTGTLDLSTSTFAGTTLTFA